MNLSYLQRRVRPIALLLAILVALPSLSWAGISATTVWQVDAAATGGDTSNGGGFDPGNASMATDLAATSATGTAPVVTSASYNFAARDVGAWLFIKSGTNWTPGWYQIASVASNAATLTATIGSARLYTNGAASSLSTVAGCATTASPTGGTWSVDYSQGTVAAVTFTDLVIDGTTNTSFTSAGNPIGKSFVGNIIAVTSGTGFTVQWVQINSVSGTTGTGDKSLGTLSSTSGHGGLGGALVSPGKVGALNNASGVVFIKTGTYAMTNSQNVSGGEMALGDHTVVGYNTTRTLTNTDATRPLLQATVNSRTLVQCNATANFINLDADANSKTGCVAFHSGSYGVLVYRCKATGGFATGFNNGWNGSMFVDCYSSGSSTGFNLGGGAHNSAVGCVSSGDASGFGVSSGSGSMRQCIAMNCAGAGFTCGSGSYGTVFENCSAYNCATTSGSCFVISIARAVCRNCVGYTASATSDHIFDVTSGTFLINCAGGNANSTIVNGNAILINFQTLTANPFTSVSTDFSLNTTAGGGALCRGAGAPATFMGLSTTASAPDIGAVQSASSSTSSTSGTGKKAGPGGGRVGFLDRPYRIHRKAG